MSSSAAKARPMTKEEAMRLVELIEADEIITSKATNASNNKLKEERWNRLTDQFNSSVSTIPRCTQQLRLKWENLKKSARKRAANMRSSRFKTGGGKEFFPPEEVLDKVAALLGTTCEGLQARYGGDAVSAEVPNVLSLDVEVQQEEMPTAMNLENIAPPTEITLEPDDVSNRLEVPLRTPSARTNKFHLHTASGSKQACKKKQEMEKASLAAKVRRDNAVADYLTAKKRKYDADTEEEELTIAKLKIDLENAQLENRRLKMLLELADEKK